MALYMLFCVWVLAPGKALSTLHYSTAWSWHNGAQDESGQAQFSQPDSSTPEQKQASIAAAQIVTGIVDSFFHQSHQAPPQSKCLVRESSKFAGNLVLTGGHTADLLGRVLSNNTASDDMKALINVETGIYHIIQMGKRIAQTCMTPDAVDTMDTAAQHLRNISYVGQHLVASNVDVLAELLDAMNAFNQGHPRLFGHYMGLALRKVLLSKSTALPEGLPSAKAVEQLSAGLLVGFFGPGSTLSFQTENNATMQPGNVQLRGSAWEQQDPSSESGHHVLQKSQAVWTVDLHQCVVGNLPFLRAAWAAMLHVLAQHAADRSNSAPSSLAIPAAVAMMELPHAMRRCNMGRKQEVMLVDSLKAISEVQARFQLPGQHSEVAETSQLMAAAARDWEEHRWLECGERLGKVLRLMTMKVFPERYQVNQAGLLQQRLLSGMTWPTAGATCTFVAGCFLGIFIVIAFPLARSLRWLQLKGPSPNRSLMLMQELTTETCHRLVTDGSHSE